jgi:hypothetical protein
VCFKIREAPQPRELLEKFLQVLTVKPFGIADDTGKGEVFIGDSVGLYAGDVGSYTDTDAASRFLQIEPKESAILEITTPFNYLRGQIEPIITLKDDGFLLVGGHQSSLLLNVSVREPDLCCLILKPPDAGQEYPKRIREI